MQVQSSNLDESTVRVLVPTGMLGSGIEPETVDRGIQLGAHVIAVDGGSTDSGPHYLGTGTAKTADLAVARDVSLLVRASRDANIPLIIGSSGTSGTSKGVDWVAEMVRAAADDAVLSLKMARIYSDVAQETVLEKMACGQVAALEPAGELDPSTVEKCSHIVGLMGHEPIVSALDAGADVLVCGRTTDTAVLAAFPLARGCPPGPTWHSAKIAECGGLCTTSPRSGGVLVSIDGNGFEIEPLDPAAACTPISVAAHMLYENADPFQMREPAGMIDASEATYKALDDRRVRVEGAKFIPQDYTIKLEGAGVSGFETISFAGIRDPQILDHIDEWLVTFEKAVMDRVKAVNGPSADDFDIDVRCYGHNAVLRDLDQSTAAPNEVGVVLAVRARQQETATMIAKIGNPLLLHMPLPGMSHMPSYAFMSSPAEMERGPVYEFLLQHTVQVESPDEIFTTSWTEISNV